jgi:hypothetical protein
MKTCASFLKTVAGSALSMGLIAMTPQTPAQPDHHDAAHARIRVNRNDDGSLKRGIQNQIETENWSGYAVATFMSGSAPAYTSATATWTVPTVSYQTPPQVCQTYTFGRRTEELCSTAHPSAEYSASWVGIGGFCTSASCSEADNTLIQLGTEQDVSSRGATQYYAWIEALPESEQPLCESTLKCAYPVNPGDTITASLTCEPGCAPAGTTQTWTLTLQDTPKGTGEPWTYTTQVSYQSSLASAEWIQEAPSSSGGILALADYASVTFNTDNDFGNTGSVSFANNGIIMIDPYGETSVPSTPVSGEFSACWGNNPNPPFKSCTAP